MNLEVGDRVTIHPRSVFYSDGVFTVEDVDGSGVFLKEKQYLLFMHSSLIKVGDNKSPRKRVL